MKILEVFKLWVESSQKILTDLASHRISQAVDIFKAVKKAVDTVNSNELSKGEKPTEFFEMVAKHISESPQKVNKLRNIAHMALKEYKTAIEQTSAQMVLDLGQDSKLANSIPDYKVGFILRSVLGANASSDYTLKQNDTEQFMTVLKASLKDGGNYADMVKHFESLSGLCGHLANGTLFDNPFFKVDKKTDKDPEKKTDKKTETIDLAVHKKTINENDKAHKAKTKEMTASNAVLQEKVKALGLANAKYIKKIAELNAQVKALQADNSQMAKILYSETNRKLTVEK